MRFQKIDYDAPGVTMTASILTLVAIPVVLYIIFAVWPESLARQLAAVGGILTVLCFALARRKYDTLLLACIFFSQFAVSLHSFDLDPPVKLQIVFSDVMLALLLLVVLERRVRIRLDSMGWLFLVWVGWLGIATCFSVHPHRSFLFTTIQLKYLVLYVLVLNAPLSESLRKWLPTVVVCLLLTQGAVAIAQLVHGGWLGLSILGEPVSALGGYFVRGRLRVAGTVSGTNGFAGYMAMFLVFLFPFVLVRRTWWRYLGFGIGGVALIVALSRAGWLSFIVGGACVVYMMLRQRLVRFTRLMLFGFLGGLILMLGIAVYSEQIMSRFEDRDAVSSAMGRIGQFPVAWRVIEKHPLIGIGPGVTEFFGRWNNDRVYVQKALPGVDMPNQVHNSELQIWIESGTPGLILFLAIVWLVFLSVFRKVKSGNGPVTKELLRIGGISAAVAVMVHVSFGTEINNQQILTVFWLLLGLARNRNSEDLERHGDRVTQEGARGN